MGLLRVGPLEGRSLGGLLRAGTPERRSVGGSLRTGPLEGRSPVAVPCSDSCSVP